MKRKYALAAALVGALVLPLCSCGGSAEAIKREAYEYLASRYSAEFTIISAEREADGPGPLPDLNPSYHWVLTVMSDQFPDETFVMRRLRTNGKKWCWLDDYFTLLLREEATNYFAEIIEPYLNTPYVG